MKTKQNIRPDMADKSGNWISLRIKHDKKLHINSTVIQFLFTS